MGALLGKCSANFGSQVKDVAAFCARAQSFAWTNSELTTKFA